MLKRPRPRFLTISFSFLAVFILILNACGGATSSTSTPTTGAAVKGGTWIDDLFEEPDSLIPNLSSETFAYMVQYGLYAPLLYGDDQGKVHPGIATAVPTVQNGGVSADLKTVTFHLRSGLVWSDGQPLDARDVDYSWKLWANPKAAAYTTIAFVDIASADVSSDNLSITFHLKQGFEPFVSVWADAGFAPLPAHHFSGMVPDQILTSSENLDPRVTSGPFMMRDSRPGDHYTVVRNPDYYQAAQGYPYLDSIIFRVVPNQNTILKDLQSSQLPPNGFNVAFYCNHQLDTLFLQEQHTADPAQRQQLFDQIHQIYLTDFPFITLYSPVDLAMHKKLVHNYMPGPEGAAEDNMVWLWWCNGGHC